VSTTRIPAALRERVADQSRHRCGYCLTAEAVVGMAMNVDHLIPEARGGPTEEANLWLACPDCNVAKGDRITALDPTTAETVPLFNPRRDRWSEHFAWTEEGDTIVGRTPIGRATVLALRMNRPLVVRARRLWVRIGVHPLGEDNGEG
jgi:5-methylcytosine-specific restriction endonuclease McrA